MTRQKSIEEKIIIAAIECVERYGLTGATSRRIAATAGVNLAAINYYFRSKDALIERVMQTTLENAFDFENFDPMPGKSAEEYCAAIFKDLLEGGLRYPGISRAHFYELFNRGQRNPLLNERIDRFISRLVDDLAARGTLLSQDDLRLACTQIMYSVLMAVLDPGLFKNSGVDLENDTMRALFIRRLVTRLLADGPCEVNHAA